MAIDPVAEPAAAAFLALLRANPNLTVFDGPAPLDQRPPYLVVYFAGGPRLGDGLRRQPDKATMRAYVHAAGETTAAARILGGHVDAAVLGERLTVPGWDCGPVDCELANPPVPDKSTGVLVMDAVSTWVWWMTAA
ncbi:DUF3168 domain-containing protein [Glycomyces artemisiae]|uniref:Uncharacterized protein DUF3168 n=1 Tax=Glycomyces artemisiae TaxID=1076443 RepID=A0A2T0UES6_9ACTN|nr:DUF3168 domain-containing protein [Glycomyces artemisiae]PRY56440.1 uncharacterized protein DUF3168 [Glycomyces artemisiae]